jgi:V/A-type H+-transporting ATPase subunit C
MGVKSRVHYSQLLTVDEYHALLESTTIAEIADILKHTEAYADALSTLPPNQVHRIDLEVAIRSSILGEAECFTTYMSGPRKAFFFDWLSWYESENLKSVFRWILSRRLDRDAMRKRLFDVPGSKISYDQLLNSRDYGEALDALRGTRYYNDIQAPIKRLQEGHKSLFSLEIAIDNLSELSIYNDLKNLPPKEAALLKTLFGARVDLLNLYNFHRCMWYYSMSLEETLSRMLPVKYKVKTRHLREMSRAGSHWKDRLASIEHLFPAYTSVFHESLEDEDSELLLEMSIKRFLYNKALKIFSSGMPGFHTVMGYFSLKSYEIDDIIKIIEDVRYGYDLRRSTRYLIRPLITGGEPKWQ